MADLFGVKEHVEHFAASRANANEVFSSRLVTDAAEIRMLDKHVDEFLALLKKDAQTHELDALKKHAKAFEKELHDELEFLFKATLQDLELYKKIMSSLTTYKKELRAIVGDNDLVTLASSEINYADLLLQTAHEKLETLALLFRKLK